MSIHDDDLEDAPGWRAIADALTAAFPGRLHGVYRMVGTGPLDPNEQPLVAVLVHKLDDAFHYCGIGMSDLFEKGDPESEYSGWGFELTFRLARDARDPNLPTWPMGLLQRLARNAIRRELGFYPNQHNALGSPLVPGSRLDALLFANDPSLSPMSTPLGKVIPTQVVGVTDEEEGLIAEWSAARFIEMVRPVSPSLVTDPARRSWLDDPSLGPAMREAAAREGSELEGIRTDHLRWVADGPRFLVEIGPAAETRRNVPRALRSRTRFGRPMTIYGEEQRITLQLGASPGCAASGPELVITLDELARAAIERAIPGLAVGAPWSPPSAPAVRFVLVE